MKLLHSEHSAASFHGPTHVFYWRTEYFSITLLLQHLRLTGHLPLLGLELISLCYYYYDRLARIIGTCDLHRRTDSTFRLANFMFSAQCFDKLVQAVSTG